MLNFLFRNAVDPDDDRKKEKYKEEQGNNRINADPDDLFQIG